jgi:hypothetical protein
MSVLVTGVPTRKRANRKLKMRDVEPKGATYSEVGSVSERHTWTDGEEAAHLLASILGRAYYRLVGTDWHR